MIEVTRVGKFKVPVRRHNFCTIVTMSGGEHGRRERGDFCFWTAVLAEPVRMDGKLRKKIFGRAHVSLSAGDRFDRMKREMKKSRAKETYAFFWNNLLRGGDNIKFIRPSTAGEVKMWLKTHEKDAKYFASALIGGKVCNL